MAGRWHRSSPTGPTAGWPQVLASNGQSFAASQTHWYRLADGRIVWHAANRDDLGQARQLGWVPPRPAFLVRSALVGRRLRRAGQDRSTVPPVRQ